MPFTDEVRIVVTYFSSREKATLLRSCLSGCLSIWGFMRLKKPISAPIILLYWNNDNLQIKPVKRACRQNPVCENSLIGSINDPSWLHQSDETKKGR